MRQFAISDIHGHNRTFRALLKKIDFTVHDELFLLGDFIDRGPDSKGVIDHVEKLKATGHQVYCLKGNHEQMVLDAEFGNTTWQAWLKYGGRETCASFGTYGDWFVPEPYHSWMEDLPLYLTTPGYIFVHAGIDTRKEDPMADRAGMLWSRDWYGSINKEWLDGRIIVHGHTPCSRTDIEMSVSALDQLPAINIDNGCFAPASQGMHCLCALELGTHALTFQENVG